MPLVVSSGLTSAVLVIRGGSSVDITSAAVQAFWSSSGSSLPLSNERVTTRPLSTGRGPLQEFWVRHLFGHELSDGSAQALDGPALAAGIQDPYDIVPCVGRRHPLNFGHLLAGRGNARIKVDPRSGRSR